MTKKTKKKKSLKLFWSSNAPWSQSGYGQQIADLLPRMVKDGHEMALSAFYGLDGGIIELDGIRCYPRMADKWGSDGISNHSVNFKADIVFTLQDLWVVNPEELKRAKRWIPIVPIDHDPIPDSILQRLKMAYRVITMSPFGHRELLRNGMHSTYIQHTVDTEVFKPHDKKEIRKKIGIPEDIFLFGMVSANKDNPPRKSFQEVMDAFVIFNKKHPKSGIYFHTLLEQNGGFNIKNYAAHLGISDKIYHVQPYEQLYGVDKYSMAKVYSSFDALLCPSSNEGFGVPIIEAQACGVPVIVNDFTSMPDLIKPGKTGFMCDVAYKRFTPLNSYIGIPSVESIYNNMEKVYSADREKMGKAARNFMKKEFDSKVIYKKKWQPLLSKLYSEVHSADVDSKE